MKRMISLNRRNCASQPGGAAIAAWADGPFIETLLPNPEFGLVCLITSTDVNDHYRFFPVDSLIGFGASSEPFRSLIGEGYDKALTLLVCEKIFYDDDYLNPSRTTTYSVLQVSHLIGVSQEFELSGERCVTLFVEDSYHPNQGSYDRTFPTCSNAYNVKLSQMVGSPVDNSLIAPTMRDMTWNDGESPDCIVGHLTSFTPGNNQAFFDQVEYQASFMQYNLKKQNEWFTTPCVLTKAGKVSLSGDLFRHLVLSCAMSDGKVYKLEGHFASPVAYQQNDQDGHDLWWAGLKITSANQPPSLTFVPYSRFMPDISSVDVHALYLVWR